MAQSVCCSIYAVRFGAVEYVSGLQAGPMEVIDLGSEPSRVYETLIEWIVGLGVFHPKAAAGFEASRTRNTCHELI